MSYSNLVSTQTLADHLSDPNWLVADCRFYLADVQQGRREYLAAHIPGAVYVHLDEHLSASIVPGVTGRHPLPVPEQAGQIFGKMGIGAGVQVVAYDAAGGAMAARLWWMLRWLGHTHVAVLDGGWQRWQSEQRPLQAGLQSVPSRLFLPQAHPEMLLDVDQVESMREDPASRLLDARSLERYHGQNETIDARPGHIPGAFSAPFSENLNPDFTFRSPAELHMRYAALLEGTLPENSAVYCGSGVTAAHNILAMLVAGMGEARLYAGSWSEWITDPTRPIES